MKCKLHLICKIPLAGYTRGQRITDPAEIKKLTKDRAHHFVRVRTIVRENAPASTEVPASK